MEVTRFDGYASEEKLAIAKGYLWPRQRERNGLREDEVEISDEMIRTVIAEYTREAGGGGGRRGGGGARHDPAQDRDQDRRLPARAGRPTPGQAQLGAHRGRGRQRQEAGRAEQD